MTPMRWHISKENTTNFALASLDNVDLLIFKSSSSGYFVTNSATKTKVSNFVASGGGLYVELGGDYPALDYAWVPSAGIASTFGNTPSSDNIGIAHPPHPIADGVTDVGLDNWVNSSHGDFTAVGGLDIVFINANTGLPVTLAGSYGSGRVVYSNLDPTSHGASHATALLVLENICKFAVSGGGSDFFNVWLGTNAAELSLVASNLTETTFDPGPLAFNTTYYWQVVAQICARATGALWSFTTALDDVRFASVTNTISEGGGAALITVVRENTNAGPVLVQYATTNGTATSDLDYVAVNGTLEFVAGLASTNIVVPVLDDGLSEFSETVLLRLSPASSNLLLGSETTLTILDDDIPRVSLFYDPAYVDPSGTETGEATNVIAALKAKGFLVQSFTGISATAFSNALVTADILYIPDLQVGDLATALSASAKSVISNFVADGGGLIINGESGNHDEDFVNQVFGHSITSGTWGGPSALTGAAAGTAFAGGPSTIPQNNDTYEWLRSSLPAGSRSIYQDVGASYTTVAVITCGFGKIVFLAYDWYNAAPRGTQDGGWDEVLGRAVLEAATPSYALAVDPSDGWEPVGYQAGPFNPSSKVYTLANLTASNLTWAVGGMADWMVVSPTNGVLLPSRITNVTVTLSGLAASLPPGTNTDTLVFSNLTHATSWTRPMRLAVLPRVLDHFAWSAIPSPQLVGTPFAVTITAQDEFDYPVNDFLGTVTLNGVVGTERTTNTILGSPVHTTSGTGNFTLGYAFTPDTDLTVTHVRHYFGTAVSLWTDTGTLLARQNVTSIPGTWVETPLISPVDLTAGVRYRVTTFTGGGSYYQHTSLGTSFPNGTIHGGYHINGDAFPTLADPVRWWFVDLRYTVGDAVDIPITPELSSPFINGTWSGKIIVFQPATNMYLLAVGDSGHRGKSTAFNVMGLPPIAAQYRAGSTTLEISWSGTGFRLQAQTNDPDVGVSTNWFDYPGGTNSPVIIPIDPANPSVFYRLVLP